MSARLHPWMAFLIMVAMAACAPAGSRPAARDAGGGGDGDGTIIPATDGAVGPVGPNCSAYPYTAADCDHPDIGDIMRHTDSDSDGLNDHEEICVYSTDPCQGDTDGDGFSDLAEVAARTDPNDASSGIPDSDFFVVLPYEGPREDRTLRFGTEIQLADVYFAIDTTGSMGVAINNVRSSLNTIAAALRERIPDVQMGVGRLDDFPFGGYGTAGVDEAYRNLQDITDSLPDVQSALNTLTASGGADGPESYTEAVYQIASGAGGGWSYSVSAYSIPPKTCPSVLDEPGSRFGYPCFRPGALPIVVMVGDATWHNSETGGSPYTGISPPPATFDQAAAALSAIGGRYIGVWTYTGGGYNSAAEMARRTGSVDASGSPLVYQAPAGSVSSEIINGVETLVGQTPQDVTTRTENVAGNPDEFDATLFIKSIVPVEGYRGGVPGANPGVSYSSKDATTFYGVIPGTIVDFEVDFYNDVRPPSASTQIFRARIIVVGNGVATLDTRQVYILVPADGGVILI